MRIQVVDPSSGTEGGVVSPNPHPSLPRKRGREMASPANSLPRKRGRVRVGA
jgi:hypothetical protein